MTCAAVQAGSITARDYDRLFWLPWLLSELAECVLLGLLVWVLSWWLPLVWALLG
jgi:hypothetical protein